jgi:hypothetical protein
LREKRNAEAQPDQATPPTDPEAAKDEWQRQMNLKIATGEVRLPLHRR